MTTLVFPKPRHALLSLMAWLAMVMFPAGCGSSSKVPATPRCQLASDCQNLLQCVQGYCVVACKESRDCPSGGRCITTDKGSSCQPPETATCQYTSQCTVPLVCALDQECRNQCQADIDCPSGQKCTSVTHLCADPTIDKNYNPVTNEFVGMDDAGVADGSGPSTSGLDAAADGAVDKAFDAPSVASEVGSTPVDGGAITEAGVDAGTAGSGGGNCTGKSPNAFGYTATSDSDTHYRSGVGVLTATEFLTFNGYFGPGSTDADGGQPAPVNRIDVQHFDAVTAKSKGRATSLLTAAGDGNGLYVNGAAVAPTGEIAIIYTALSFNTWGVYLAFLNKDLTVNQTAQFVALGSDAYHDQSHVQWIGGKFVASSVVGSNPVTVKVAKFGANGANAGGISVMPTDDPSGHVRWNNAGEGAMASSGNQLALAYYSAIDSLPYVSIVDGTGTLIGNPIGLPLAQSAYGPDTLAVAIAGTDQGFMAVYPGTSSTKANSLLATFVSTSLPVDAGVSPAGTTYSFPGGYPFPSPWATRGSSDGVGAGFAVLYPDGSVSFLYFSGNGSGHASPQSVLTQANAASASDEVQITNFGGRFAVSLHSSAEHLTRVVASSCQ